MKLTTEEKKLYEKSMSEVFNDPKNKGNPLELFFQMVRTAMIFSLMGDFCEDAGMARFSFYNWVYKGDAPTIRNFINVLSAMGYDVKIVKRHGDVR